MGILVASEPVYAQISAGGVPISFREAMRPDTATPVRLTPPDPGRLAAEDELDRMNYRFAVNIPVSLGIGDAGNWTVSPAGTRVWRMTIIAPGARALLVYFDRFRLGEGDRVFIYNPARTKLLGAFTARNNNRWSTFATEMVEGDAVTIEYDAPAGVALPDLRISEIGYAYRGVSSLGDAPSGFGGSGDCEVNINCEEGQDWQLEKRSVARIAVKRGTGSVWCTGSLVNNVRNDGTPYLLTADHCGRYSSETDLTQWIFYFNYEGTACANPSKEPASNSLVGATLVAHGGNAGAAGSDFFLLRLSSPVPENFNVYFNGWSRITTPPSSSGVTIHHPQGDIRKVSVYNTPLEPTFWTGGSKLAHWRVRWAATPNGHGVTEGGSSGSPLYDNLGRLVGTLTGGDASCDSAYLTAPDYYGMFSYSWDKNGTDSTEVLKYWLDPDSTDVMELNGWAVGTGEMVKEPLVTLRPNPVQDFMILSRPAGSCDDLVISVSDMLGKVVFSEEWKATAGVAKKVGTGSLAPGIYLVAVTGNGIRAVHKIIKQ